MGGINWKSLPKWEVLTGNRYQNGWY